MCIGTEPEPLGAGVSAADEAHRTRSRSAVINALVGALPVWRGKGPLPPLVGAVPAPPGYAIPVGDMVGGACVR